MKHRPTRRHHRDQSDFPTSHIVEPLERRMLLNAMPVGPEFRVNTFTTNFQNLPSAAMDADGDFVVVWQSAGNQDGSGYGIFAQRYNAAGVAQGPEFRVNTYTVLFGQQVSAVAMDGDGDFVVVWQSASQDGFGAGVYSQRYNAAGVPQGAEFRVNTFTTADQGFPSVAMDANGNFVVAWRSAAQDGNLNGVYAQRYNVAGVPQGPEFRVNTFTTDSQGQPSAAMDADGDFVVAWHSYTQDVGTTGIYTQRYNAAGVAQGTEFRVNSFTKVTQFNPSAAMDAGGAFVVTWQSFSQDGSGDGIYAQCYNAAGVAQGPEFRVNSFTTNNQHIPAVAMDADGDFVVTWKSNNQDGSGYGVYAQRYGAAVAPAVTASSFVFETAPHRVTFTFTQDVSASLGTDDIALENLTTMTTIPGGDLSLSYDSGSNTATFSYTGSGGLIPSVLPDGNHRATLLAAGITNSGGTPLSANHVFNFFFLNGDANRDARANLLDFNILAANFGQSPRDFTQGDFNYDMVVNLLDFNILASRFGQMVGPGTSSLFSSIRLGTVKAREEPLDVLLA